MAEEIGPLSRGRRLGEQGLFLDGPHDASEDIDGGGDEDELTAAAASGTSPESSGRRRIAAEEGS